MPIKFYHLLGPKHWPFWLIAGILRLTIYLPLPWLFSLGRFIGRLLMLSKKARLTTEVNIDLCFPELNQKEKNRLIKKSFESAGISIFETALAFWASNKRLQNLSTFHGQEIVDKALAKGKGIIFIGCHFSTLQIAGRLINHYFPLNVVYRTQKLPVLNYLAERAYHRHYPHAIVREDVRKLLKLLRKNECIWITPDVDAKHKASIFAPFFGIPAATIIIPTRFAEITGAAILPNGHFRRENGSGYDLHIYPALDNLPSGDIELDTQRLNEVLESIIRKKPEEYYWQYKRFKTRPNGEQNPYSARKPA